MPVWSGLAIQSHCTSLGSGMKEQARSCVSARIPKHELGSRAFGKSSEKELNLVSSETASLCSAVASPKMLCLISDHNVTVMTQKQRKPQKRGAHFPPWRFLNHPRLPCWLSQVPPLKFKAIHLSDKLIICPEPMCIVLWSHSYLQLRVNIIFLFRNEPPTHYT